MGKDPFLASGRRPAANNYVTKWRGITMERNHSLLAAIREISHVAHVRAFSCHMVTGVMSSGKTTLTNTLMHLTHLEMAKRYDRYYNVVRWGEEDLLNIEEALKDIVSDTIITIDDITLWAQKAGSQNSAEVISKLSTIRHRQEALGKDVRIIVFFNVHYSRALQKTMRQWVQTVWVTSMGHEERHNLVTMFDLLSLIHISEPTRTY